jgi:hypothetical protein
MLIPDVYCDLKNNNFVWYKHLSVRSYSLKSRWIVKFIFHVKSYRIKYKLNDNWCSRRCQAQSFHIAPGERAGSNYYMFLSLSLSLSVSVSVPFSLSSYLALTEGKNVSRAHHSLTTTTGGK